MALGATDYIFMPMKRKLVTMLVVGGSDSSGGAGIQTDIKIAAARNVYALSLITAVTAQNSKGIQKVTYLSPEDISAQLDSIISEVRPDAIKLGMIGTSENALIIGNFLKTIADTIPIVVDPVMKSSVGGILSESSQKLQDIYLRNIIPFATVVTPNLIEAALFMGKDIEDLIKEKPDRITSDLLDLFGSKSVILKGGHFPSDKFYDTMAIRSTPIEIIKFKQVRKDTPNLHGTGCAFASLIGSELAKGVPVKKAFLTTSSLMRSYITESEDYTLGNSCYGPLNIFDYNKKEVLL